MIMAVGALQALCRAGAKLRLIKFQPNSAKYKENPFECRYGHVCADFELAFSELSLINDIESVVFDLRGHCQSKFSDHQKEVLCGQLGFDLKEPAAEFTKQTAELMIWSVINPKWSPTTNAPLTSQQIGITRASWAREVEDMHSDMDERLTN